MKRWILIVLAAWLTGCVHQDRVPVAPDGIGAAGQSDDETNYAEANAMLLEPPSRVVVFQSAPADKRIEVLGLVDVHEDMGSQDRALEVLKKRAERLGADAVVDVEYHHGEGTGEPSHLSGEAVRFRDLVHGRSYRALGRIEVTGDMGKEDEAFASLREKAREEHADLILDVHFEHGEGGAEKPRLYGTAIRFVPSAQ